MNYEQLLFIALLLTALVFFVSGYIRYDLVAALTLLLAIIFGLVPIKESFIGFSHSAVITVGTLFIISRAVENTGILDEIAYYLRLRRKNIPKQILVLSSAVASLSAFINNVAAVALMIPVTLKIARIKNIPRRALLMPLSFSSLLGGLITLIGTSPNIIVSDFRKNRLGSSFHFLDFAPVGIGVAIVGVAFIAWAGWRLISLKTDKDNKPFLETFTFEFRIKSNSSLVNKKMAHLLNEYQDRAELLVVLRGGEVLRKNLKYLTVKTDDLLILETDKWTSGELTSQYGLVRGPQHQKMESMDYFLTEIILLPQSFLETKPIKDLNLIETYGIEIIAISRRNATFTKSLGDITPQTGDVLLVKSNSKLIQERLYALNCIAAGENRIRPFSKQATIKVFAIFFLAVAAVISGFVRTDIAFFTASIAMILTGCLSLDGAYRSINLPILVLIATLIPVGQAMETTGTAKLIAQGFYYYGHALPISMNLFILIVICMLFANFINTAAVALIFSPIALMIASDWSASPDPFLMAVAVGSSCTFITPVGHQANTLVLGPGNYQFSDYWRIGLPLTLILSVTATLLIRLFWSF
ncbi:permease [Legionella antarctica]|uniref:Permease n=1 Tax=Legionella antarctica TaxID=2708020 RepID=A0A6F8T5Q2_9GAMM|nr:SLC13 family permease [Legionella antarctica]BCA95362.1 permease [Legionella antarctica]